MSPKRRSAFSANAVSALFGSGTFTPLHRLLARLTLGGLLLGLVLITFEWTVDEKLGEATYAGLPVCGGVETERCLFLVAGELVSPDGVARRSRSTGKAFRADDSNRRLYVASDRALDGLKEPIQGIYVEGQLAGVQDSEGKRVPVTLPSDAHPVLFWAIVGSFGVAIASGVAFQLMTRKRPTLQA